MIVDHILTGEGFALALQNMGELYKVHLSLARSGASLDLWKRHIRMNGEIAYLKAVRTTFTITTAELDVCADLMRDYYMAHVKESA